MRIDAHDREILAALQERAQYGLDLVTGGAMRRWRMFVVLGRLDERGLIESCADSSVPPRRLYRITAAGSAALLPVAATLERSP